MQIKKANKPKRVPLNCLKIENFSEINEFDPPLIFQELEAPNGPTPLTAPMPPQNPISAK